MSRRAPEYKPLLFTTTVRNPERYKYLLYVLYKFNNQILTNDLATNIVGELIRYGLYRPIIKTSSIKDKWRSSQQGSFSEFILTDNEVEYLIVHNPQKHKEAGFEKGFPSRFATIFDFTKALGFVYYKVNERIHFSELGKKLAEIFTIRIENENIIIEQNHPEYETEAFLQSLSKYQRSNPFVRVLNDNIPLILLIETIQKLNNDSEFNNTGISRKELPLLIFWKDNNSQALYNRIKQLRNDYGYNPSDEVIIGICTEEIMGGFKEFKPNSIISEYPDEFIRKMRLTGIISLRGGGRFIDINHNEDRKVNYILEHYTIYEKYNTEREYFDYMSRVDNNLVSISSLRVDSETSEELLIKWLDIYQWEDIKKELIVLSSRNVTSKDNILKFISNPARLEFLTSLAIKSKLPNVRVIPNYPCDDEGLPTSTAGGAGDKGDIECFELPNGILVEVTLSRGRTQTMMEVWPISRHLERFKENNNVNSQCVFIAPSIFSDSQKQIDYLKTIEDQSIRPYSITEFISYLEQETTLWN